MKLDFNLFSTDRDTSKKCGQVESSKNFQHSLVNMPWNYFILSARYSTRSTSRMIRFPCPRNRHEIDDIIAINRQDQRFSWNPRKKVLRVDGPRHFSQIGRPYRITFWLSKKSEILSRFNLTINRAAKSR